MSVVPCNISFAMADFRISLFPPSWTNEEKDIFFNFISSTSESYATLVSLHRRLPNKTLCQIAMVLHAFERVQGIILIICHLIRRHAVSSRR